MGGMLLVVQDLSHTNEDVQSEAAFVIGSAAQRWENAQRKSMSFNASVYC